MQFQTEVNELLELMIHSLYSNKEIFLRELISNASDALDKRSLARASGEDASNDELEIKISCDEDAKLLIIEDSGCGMSKDELIANLGTIARSGTKAYMKEHEGKNDAELIGQFGVGFYSAFMVADKIDVYSKAINASEAFCWSSDAKGYEVEPANKDAVGTKIVLHLKEAEYASEFRIEHLINKYSKHINYAIKLQKPVKDNEGKDTGAKAYSQINTANAIWKMNKASLKNEDYIEFYKELSYGSEPLGWVHTNSEGSLEYNSLFFIPSSAPRDLMQMDYEKQCKLYVRRVLISEKEDLLPIWLRFIKGIVDVADLDLNVSREILQDNLKIKKISELSTKKVLGAIAKLEADKLDKFNELFGAVIKEGLIDPNAPHEDIYKILKFNTTKGIMSLDEYLEKYSNESKHIYFLQGENEAMLKQSALIDNYDCVILLSDRVDEYLANSLPAYKDYKWLNITEAKIDSSCDEGEQTELAKGIKEILGALINEVKFSSSLGTKPAAIVYNSEDQAYQLSKMMASFGNEGAKLVGDLVLNKESELIKLALNSKDETKLKNLAHLLYALASLSNKASLDNLNELADAAAYFALSAYEK